MRRRIGDHDAVNPTLCIGSNVRLHAKVPLIAFLGLLHGLIALMFRILRGAWSLDDARINNRAFTENQAPLRQVAFCRLKHLLSQITGSSSDGNDRSSSRLELGPSQSSRNGTSTQCRKGCLPLPGHSSHTIAA